MKNALNEHKKVVHAKESDFKFCHACNYKTPQASGLRKHIEAVHEKIKRFTCHQCPRQFYSGSQMKYHIRGKLPIVMTIFESHSVASNFQLKFFSKG